MDDQLAALIINRIDDMKNDNNRNFDLLLDGQRKLHAKMEEHEELDTTRFNGIRLEISNAKAATDAKATLTAKFWATVASVVAAIFGAFAGIFGDWFLFGRK
jgi:hypothetical protein